MMKLSTLNKTPLIISGTMLGVTLGLGTMLTSNIVSADNDSVVDQINITVPVSCTMSGTGMDSHSTEIENGLYKNNIGTTTLHAFCNDNEGFSIYTAGYTGNEIGGTNSNKLVGSSASSNATIDSGLATSSSNPDVSNWAMKLTMTQDSGDTTGTNASTIDSAPNVANPSQAEPSTPSASFSNYHIVPNEYTKVAHKDSATDMTPTTGGVKLTTTYAAYISKTQAADTYSGQVIYTLVHPSSAGAPGSISCNPNGTTIGTNPSTDVVCMQDITSTNKSTILASMTEEQQYTLTDKRDGKTYTVSKLKDGNVWMTQNLDLDLDSTKTYTNKDTDLGWNGMSYSTANLTPIRSTYTTDTNNWCEGGVVQYNSCESNDTPESYDPGELYWSRERWPNNRTSCEEAGGSWGYDGELYYCADANLVTSTGEPQHHLGNYYNWTAAVAMNNSSSHITDNELIEQSICPAGWTLPIGGSSTSSGSFRYLYEQYSIDTIMSFIFPSGRWEGSLINSGIGSSGLFWSSVIKDSKYSHGLYIEDYSYISIYPGSYNSRQAGFSIRCIVR